MARGEAIDGHVLRLHRTEGPSIDVDLAGIPSVAFARMGETQALIDEGWWLFIAADRLVAIDARCPDVERLLRFDELAAAAQAIADKAILWMVDRPGSLRNRDARQGVVVLDPADLDGLVLRAQREQVADIADFPWID